MFKFDVWIGNMYISCEDDQTMEFGKYVLSHGTEFSKCAREGEEVLNADVISCGKLNSSRFEYMCLMSADKFN